MQAKLNGNITGLKESATLAINQKARAARKEGKEVYHFGFGQSPFPVHPKIQKALADNAHQKDYLPTRGAPELCEAIANYYEKHFNYSFSSEDILVGPGSKELLFQALYTLEGPVFVPAPSWVSYGPQLNIRGKQIEAIVTKYKNNYKLQAEELDSAWLEVRAEQSILILNNPSNPTGSVYTKEEIEALSKVCRERNIIVVSDEIYAQVNFSKNKYVGMAEYYPEGTLVTGGISKSHSAGGYRMGFLAIPENMNEFMKALCAMISETFSAVSAPIQYASLKAYSDDQDILNYVDRCTQIHGAAGSYLHQRFIKMGLKCPKPEGAFYLFPDFSPFAKKLESIGIKNCDQLANQLFEKAKVAILPGLDFYYPENLLGLRVASVDYDGQKVYENSLGKTLDDQFIESFCPNLKLGCDQIEKFLNSL